MALHVGEGQTQGGTGGGDVLEGGGGRQAGGLLQGLDQLPGVEGIHEVDVAGLAVEHLQGQLALLHEDAGGLLVGVTAVFQFQFGHRISSFLIGILGIEGFIVEGSVLTTGKGTAVGSAEQGDQVGVIIADGVEGVDSDVGGVAEVLFALHSGKEAPAAVLTLPFRLFPVAVAYRFAGDSDLVRQAAGPSQSFRRGRISGSESL